MNFSNLFWEVLGESSGKFGLTGWVVLLFPRYAEMSIFEVTLAIFIGGMVNSLWSLFIGPIIRFCIGIAEFKVHPYMKKNWLARKPGSWLSKGWAWIAKAGSARRIRFQVKQAELKAGGGGSDLKLALLIGMFSPNAVCSILYLRGNSFCRIYLMCAIPLLLWSIFYATAWRLYIGPAALDIASFFFRETFRLYFVGIYYIIQKARFIF
jgi:hypothetical protein